MFFEPFPKTEYEINDEYTTLTNIVIANMLKRRQIDKRYAFKTYKNTQGKKIEEISYELYGDGRLWWTILVANEFITPYNLVFNKSRTKKYCEEKYGINNVFSIHHYYNDKDKRIVDDLDTLKYKNGKKVPFHILPISNFEHEQNLLNNVDIFYITPTYIQTFIEEYRNEIKGN